MGSFSGLLILSMGMFIGSIVFGYIPILLLGNNPGIPSAKLKLAPWPGPWTGMSHVSLQRLRYANALGAGLFVGTGRAEFLVAYELWPTLSLGFLFQLSPLLSLKGQHYCWLHKQTVTRIHRRRSILRRCLSFIVVIVLLGSIIAVLVLFIAEYSRRAAAYWMFTSFGIWYSNLSGLCRHDDYWTPLCFHTLTW